MDPALLLLDSLQKEVQKGLVDVTNTCFKLRDIIHEIAKDDSRHFFRQIFPKLLHFIIGHHSSPGLLEMCNNARSSFELKSLLDPQGELFSAILYLQASDSLTRFEVPLSDFSDDPSLQGSGKTLKLDYCDFFYFHLIKIVTALPVSNVEASKTAKPQQYGVGEIYRKFVSFGLGTNFNEHNCRWNHDLVAEAFLHILKAHLEFALPSNPVAQMNVFNSHIFRSKIMAAGRLGESLIGIVNQLWLTQPSKNARKLPSLDVVHAAEMTIKHLCEAMCYNPGSNRYMTQTIENAFTSARLHLYHFLKANIQDWPMDHNFIALVAVWRAFVAPWTYISLNDNIAFWNPYVLNNFCFYILPFSLILEHIEGVLEALVSLQVRTKLVLQGDDFVRRLAPCIDCLLLTMRTVAPVAELLRGVESHELMGRKAGPYADFKIREQFLVLEPDCRTLPIAFDRKCSDMAMSIIRWLERTHTCLQKMPESPADLALDGKVLECQDEVARAFAIDDAAYARYLQAKDLEERAEAEQNLAPRRRNLIPSSPDSRQAGLKDLKVRTKSFRNDEIPILLAVFTFLTEKINLGLKMALVKLEERGCAVPQLISEHTKVNLKPLAVWQNLLFTIFSLLLTYIAFKIVF